MTRTTPPFRADHVGSLLRPASLKEARSRRERGEISAKDLRAAEDAAIEHIIARQADVGLRSATDGEFRRAMWHFDFLEHLDGVESFRSDHGIAFKGGIETQAKGLRVTGKLGFTTHPMLDHFRFLRDHTRATPKMTIPSPSVLHFRGGRRAVSSQVYPDMEEFYRDLALAYRGAVGKHGGNAQNNRPPVFHRREFGDYPDRPHGHWHGSVWPVGYSNQHYGKAISTLF